MHCIHQLQVRDEALRERESLSVETETLVLTVQRFINARVDHHELRIDGCMYDIRSVRQAGGLVTAVVIRDYKEEGVLAFIRRLVDQDSGEKGRPPLQLAKFFLSGFLIPDQLLLQLRHCFSSISFVCMSSATMQKVSMGIEGPPPEHLCFS